MLGCFGSNKMGKMGRRRRKIGKTSSNRIRVRIRMRMRIEQRRSLAFLQCVFSGEDEDEACLLKSRVKMMRIEQSRWHVELVWFFFSVCFRVKMRMSPQIKDDDDEDWA